MDVISTTSDHLDSVSELETHTLSKRHSLSCVSNDDADDASVDRIKEGISHLRGVDGKPTLAAGKCERVSCSWGDAILWCNDVSTLYLVTLTSPPLLYFYQYSTA